MKKVLIITFIITTSLYSCNGQEQKHISHQTPNINLDTLPKLKTIVDGLVKGNSVTSAHVGEGGSPSPQWDKYEKLKEIAKVDQLVALTDHYSGVVRCYAFHALASKKYDRIFSILLNHLDDTTEISTQMGCIGGTEYVGDYLIDVLTPDYVDLDVLKMNNSQINVLDSVLINKKGIVLLAKHSAIERLEGSPSNYNKIREFVEKERNVIALEKLAKYRKQSDKDLIASFFKNDDTQSSALYAVREFPDEYFYPFVKNIFEKEWKETLYDYGKWKICYQVLARYPRPGTLELFERTIGSKDEFRYNTLGKYLLIAISKYPHPIHEPLKVKIKLDRISMEEVEEEVGK